MIDPQDHEALIAQANKLLGLTGDNDGLDEFDAPFIINEDTEDLGETSWDRCEGCDCSDPDECTEDNQ
tara:strand:+ start:241 stop:444 length:204 start_codon:yes stop_codon:yes gene_type:complete